MAKIKPKARVIYFPLLLRQQPIQRSCDDGGGGGGILKIAWPHRWEHDKNPESFFECLFRLKSDGFRFRVAVLGESYNEKPPIFDEFRYTVLCIFSRTLFRKLHCTVFSKDIALERIVNIFIE